jgi:hypothetical protein
MAAQETLVQLKKEVYDSLRLLNHALGLPDIRFCGGIPKVSTGRQYFGLLGSLIQILFLTSENVRL